MRRRGGSNVRDKLDDRRIRFVTNGGDEWQRTGKRSVCDYALVECPQILSRPPTAGDEYGVHAERFAVCVDHLNRGCDLLSCAFPLHANISDEQTHCFTTLGGGSHDILPSSAAFGRNHRNPTGKNGQRLLARLVEIPERAQLIAHLAEHQVQRSRADGFERADVQLGSTLRSVVTDVTGRDDLVTFGRDELELLYGRRPRHTVENGLVVLEREIPVVGSTEVAHLADHAQRRGHPLLERRLDQLSHLADRQVLGFLETPSLRLAPSRGIGGLRTNRTIRIKGQAFHRPMMIW